MNEQWLLHYPVWDLDIFGGGFLIALIATIHVYIAHFAVGGGLFLVLTEIKARRENDPAILEYTRKHSGFFLLLTMVFGALTGVGIWFIISVVSPAATSILIHRFVFGWATEWTFFVAEIAALFVYYYYFNKMAPKQHIRVGWIYFTFAWLSLFTVAGIISWMLTPGEWLETKNFWHGFFNPSFWPSVFFRTFIAFMFAGLFGYITALFLKDEKTRQKMVRYCSWWLILPLPLLLMSGWCYFMTLDDPIRAMILGRSPEILPYFKAFLWISPLLFIIGVIMALRLPLMLKRTIAFALIFIGLAYMGSFEWVREAGRRPYIIYGYAYSNGVLAEDMAQMKEQGILKSARWTEFDKVAKGDQIRAGKRLYNFMCLPCHSVGGIFNDILPITENFDLFGMEAMLDGMGKINDYMPPFPGNRAEQKALAAYIVTGLHKKPADPSIRPTAPQQPEPIEVPPFFDSDEYLLMAWSTKGMHMLTDADARLSLSPPGNDLYAQLIRRGELPEHVTDRVKISYTLEPGFQDPAAKVDFWKWSEPLTGKEVQKNTGLFGNQTQGEMTFDNNRFAFRAKGIPAVPYPSGSTGKNLFIPYPIATVTATDAETGEVLAVTKTTAPVSTEMGCKSCHGGNWRVADIAGISEKTADDILAVHDRMNGTDLSAKAENNEPRTCQHCHRDENLEERMGEIAAEGEIALPMNLSAAIHGFHANYLTGRGDDACGACHPASPETYTAGFRGIHGELFMGCTNCHGAMEDHALSLLLSEKSAGKKGAKKLMAHLSPRGADSTDAIQPRKPWINEPDCLHCHVDFAPPETDMAPLDQRTASMDDLFRFRTDAAGIMCAGCHGSPHAIYPASNQFGGDSLGPIQYQKNPYPIGANRNCRVCHTVDMEEEMHHPNSLTDFRNVQ